MEEVRLEKEKVKVEWNRREGKVKKAIGGYRRKGNRK